MYVIVTIDRAECLASGYYASSVASRHRIDPMQRQTVLYTAAKSTLLGPAFVNR